MSKLLNACRSRAMWLLCGMSLCLIAARSHAQRPTAAARPFPSELVEFVPYAKNPLFEGTGPGHWDATIRERGWILREGDAYTLWCTGQADTPERSCRLGYATSSDGLKWQRQTAEPILPDDWVEDMMVVKHGDTYYMFAEGAGDRAQLLTSHDRVHWERRGTLDVRRVDGRPISPGPFGTPTAWLEGDTWYLFYERLDQGVWLCKSADMKVWTNVDDHPVLLPGPESYDRQMIALNQVIKHDGTYYAYYHGSGPPAGGKRTWTTNVARSTDLVHWEKYDKNPIVVGDKSSGIVVFDGQAYRLYTMHRTVEVYLPRAE